jgi:hypothetical protein
MRTDRKLEASENRNSKPWKKENKLSALDFVSTSLPMKREKPTIEEFLKRLEIRRRQSNMKRVCGLLVH